MAERSDAIRRALELERLTKSRALRGQAVRLVDEHLTMHQFHALAVLGAEGEMATLALAEALGAKPSVVTGIVQRLVERNLVERAADPHDRRVHLVHLTDAGHSLIAETFDELERASGERIATLSDEQLASYIGILETFTAP